MAPDTGIEARPAPFTSMTAGFPQFPTICMRLWSQGNSRRRGAEIHRSRPAGTVDDEGHFAIMDGRQQPLLICDGVIIRNGVRGDNPDAPPIDSFVCLGVVNGKFFKVRTSMPRQPDSKAEVRSFVAAWVDRLWNSGAASAGVTR